MSSNRSNERRIVRDEEEKLSVKRDGHLALRGCGELSTSSKSCRRDAPMRKHDATAATAAMTVATATTTTSTTTTTTATTTTTTTTGSATATTTTRTSSVAPSTKSTAASTSAATRLSNPVSTRPSAAIQATTPRTAVGGGGVSCASAATLSAASSGGGCGVAASGVSSSSSSCSTSSNNVSSSGSYAEHQNKTSTNNNMAGADNRNAKNHPGNGSPSAKAGQPKDERQALTEPPVDSTKKVTSAKTSPTALSSIGGLKKVQFSEDDIIQLMSPQPKGTPFVKPDRCQSRKLRRTAARMKLYQQKYGNPLPEEYYDVTPPSLVEALDKEMADQVRRKLRSKIMSQIRLQQLSSRNPEDDRLPLLEKCDRANCREKGHCVRECYKDSDAPLDAEALAHSWPSSLSKRLLRSSLSTERALTRRARLKKLSKKCSQPTREQRDDVPKIESVQPGPDTQKSADAEPTPFQLSGITLSHSRVASSGASVPHDAQPSSSATTSTDCERLSSTMDSACVIQTADATLPSRHRPRTARSLLRRLSEIRQAISNEFSPQCSSDAMRRLRQETLQDASQTMTVREANVSPVEPPAVKERASRHTSPVEGTSELGTSRLAPAEQSTRSGGSSRTSSQEVRRHDSSACTSISAGSTPVGTGSMSHYSSQVVGYEPSSCTPLGTPATPMSHDASQRLGSSQDVDRRAASGCKSAPSLSRSGSASQRPSRHHFEPLGSPGPVSQVLFPLAPQDPLQVIDRSVNLQQSKHDTYGSSAQNYVASPANLSRPAVRKSMSRESSSISGQHALPVICPSIANRATSRGPRDGEASSSSSNVGGVSSGSSSHESSAPDRTSGAAAAAAVTVNQSRTTSQKPSATMRTTGASGAVYGAAAAAAAAASAAAASASAAAVSAAVVATNAAVSRHTSQRATTTTYRASHDEVGSPDRTLGHYQAVPVSAEPASRRTSQAVSRHSSQADSRHTSRTARQHPTARDAANFRESLLEVNSQPVSASASILSTADCLSMVSTPALPDATQLPSSTSDHSRGSSHSSSHSRSSSSGKRASVEQGPATMTALSGKVRASSCAADSQRLSNPPGSPHHSTPAPLAGPSQRPSQRHDDEPASDSYSSIGAPRDKRAR